MQQATRMDVYGLSIRGREQGRDRDHFAVASLSKSMRLHQSNLTVENEHRVHGDNQGHLLLVTRGMSDEPIVSPERGTAVDAVVQYFLNEMPWYHFADGEPSDVLVALEDAMRNARAELLRCGLRDPDTPDPSLTLAFVIWPDLYVAHLGDNHCYLGRQGKVRSLVADDPRPRNGRKRWRGSLGRRLRGRIRGAEVPADGLRPDVRHFGLRAGDVLALLTPDVARDADRPSLESVLHRNAAAEQLCGRLVGGPASEDRTAVVVRFLPPEDQRAGLQPVPAPPELAVQRNRPAARACHPRAVSARCEDGPPRRSAAC